jgi:hypothetical protein
VRRRLLSLALLALALPLASCGNERVRPSGLAKLGPPTSFASYSNASGDVSFGYPSTWTVSNGRFPQVAQISSGKAVAAIYSYPRTDLPSDAAAVTASRKRLLRSLRERAPGFRVQGSHLSEVDDAPAVEILGSGRVGGQRVETRSVHVFKGSAEYVIDAYAAPGTFERANTIAFEPLLATIRLGGSPDEAPGSD